MNSAEVKIKSHISKIEYGISPRRYVNKGEAVTIQVMVMGKRMNNDTWAKIPVTINVEADPANPAIQPTVSSGGTISFTPDSDTWIRMTFEGDDTYMGSENKVLIGVLHFSSPFLSSHFIMLFIILIIALLSYRLFSRGKLDINSVWGEIRGD